MTDKNYQTMFLLAAREQHEKAINRAVQAKRPFTLTGIEDGKRFPAGGRQFPNHLPHCEAIVEALAEHREFFVWREYDQRYLTSDELAALLVESGR